MVKELQDLVWSCLPKEFKEEVKYEYSRVATKVIKSNYDLGFMNAHEGMYGIHNLISDAEGEEALTCEKSRVQEAYKTSKEIVNNEQYGTCQYSMHTQIMCVLENLFGTKCLPDKVDEDNFVKLGPKYRKGEKVCYNGYVYEIEGLVGKNRYALKGLNFDLDEDMIDPYEPYTEPSSQKSPENCDNGNHISTECDKTVDPKFKAGNRVIYKNTGKVKIVVNIAEDSRYVVASPDGKSPYLAKESDLKPYIEPEEDLIPSNSGKLKSQEADNQYRNLSKNIENFDKSNCNRLTIAAMAMQGILSNADRMKQYGEIAIRECMSLTGLIAANALRYADALIAEAEKGGEK